MVHKIVVKPVVAHLLTKVSKREKFYFRCLTRTDKVKQMDVEIADKGIDYLDASNITYTKIK